MQQLILDATRCVGGSVSHCSSDDPRWMRFVTRGGDAVDSGVLACFCEMWISLLSAACQLNLSNWHVAGSRLAGTPRCCTPPIRRCSCALNLKPTAERTARWADAESKRGAFWANFDAAKMGWLFLEIRYSSADEFFCQWWADRLKVRWHLRVFFMALFSIQNC